MGADWTLVRHVAQGSTWYAATDNLAGLDEYGVASNQLQSATSFSTYFFDAPAANLQYLFATGDMQKWLVADANMVNGDYYYDQRRIISHSSANPNGPTAAYWYNRESNAEDPLVSIFDWGYGETDALYVENSSQDATDLVQQHAGANVFIRGM